MNIRFEEVSKDNWIACTHLTVEEEQRNFVAPNWYSIIEASFEETYTPLCVYDEDVMVGFVMYGLDPETNTWWIPRVMIDRKSQGRGYGKEITRQILQVIKEKAGDVKVYLSYEPENAHAKAMYRKVGFKDTGREEDGEEVVAIDLSEI